MLIAPSYSLNHHARLVLSMNIQTPPMNRKPLSSWLTRERVTPESFPGNRAQPSLVERALHAATLQPGTSDRAGYWVVSRCSWRLHRTLSNHITRGLPSAANQRSGAVLSPTPHLRCQASASYSPALHSDSQNSVTSWMARVVRDGDACMAWVRLDLPWVPAA
jgi:hypothetical protein